MFIEAKNAVGGEAILINTANIERIDYVSGSSDARIYMISGAEVDVPKPTGLAGFDALLEKFNERLKAT